MGDDAGCHELPFAFPVADYAALAEGVRLPITRERDYTILVHGTGCLGFAITMLREEGRLRVALIRPNAFLASPIFQLLISDVYLSIRCCVTGHRYRKRAGNMSLSLLPKVMDLPPGLDPLPSPFHLYTLKGSIRFQLDGNPTLLQLSNLAAPSTPLHPHPFYRDNDNKWGLKFREVEAGLSGLASKDRVEVRCSDNRSLYISKDHIHCLTFTSKFAKEALSSGKDCLSLESYPASVVGISCEALFHWQGIGNGLFAFSDLTAGGPWANLDMPWTDLERLGHLFLRLRITNAPLDRKLRKQLERALVSGLTEEASAMEAVQALTLASRAQFRLLYNRGITALALASDWEAWLYTAQTNNFPFYREALLLLRQLTRVHTRPLP